MENIYDPVKLKKLPGWSEKIAEMSRKYNRQPIHFYHIIYGETVPKWNFASLNRSTKAAGAFQFTPNTLQWLNHQYGLHLDTEMVLEMTPAEQLKLYDKYLESWGYDGGVELGFMQAAPGKYYTLRKEGKRISNDLIVYPVGSPAWKVNPGWRERGRGHITIGSINDYYKKARTREVMKNVMKDI